MPKIRHGANLNIANRGRVAAQRGGYPTVTDSDAKMSCIGSNHCAQPVVPDAPVPLCGKHIREVYAFAADLLVDRWDSTMREYVSELHATFKPPKAVKQPLAGWVYFIRFGDRVKVGYTTNVDKRLKDLPHEEVIGYTPGTREDEAAWHKLLADYHVVGEWFQADPAVLTALAKVVERSA